MKKLIEICIPTYNRKHEVERLLDLICLEIKSFDLGGYVGVSVYNNSQADKFTKKLNWDDNVKVIQNEENIGAAANVVQCMKKANGDYVWILGDDDLPCVGLLQKVVEFLSGNKIDLMYIDAKWYSAQEIRVKKMSCDPEFLNLDPNSFSKWRGDKLTFISSFIYNRANYEEISGNYEKYKNTLLPHLEVYLTLLSKAGCKISAIKNRAICATGGAGGGYSLIKVFNHEVCNILMEKVPDKNLYKILVRKHVVLLLRMLVSLKRGKLGSFEWENDINQVNNGLIKSKQLQKIMRESMFATFIRYIAYRMLKVI